MFSIVLFDPHQHIWSSRGLQDFLNANISTLFFYSTANALIIAQQRIPAIVRIWASNPGTTSKAVSKKASISGNRPWFSNATTSVGVTFPAVTIELFSTAFQQGCKCTGPLVWDGACDLWRTFPKALLCVNTLESSFPIQKLRLERIRIYLIWTIRWVKNYFRKYFIFLTFFGVFTRAQFI